MMPEYNLYCDDCDQDIEIFCSISEYESRMKHIVCPNCTSRNIYRNYQHDNVYSSVKDVKTVGQLADRNAQKNKIKIAEEKQKQLEKNPTTKQPWYKDKKYGEVSYKEINQMSSQQKTKYIMEGKK